MLDLDSAILYTTDINRIREFYEKIIGLKFEYQDRDHYVSFIFPNGAKLGINKSTLPREIPGVQTFFLRVDDIKQQYEKYKKLEFEIYEPYQVYDWGIYFAILDPDRNKIGFIQPKNK
jgi:predicted enzyme related to lactoylglutathione lyase